MNFPPSIRQDWANHAVYGQLIGAAAALVCWRLCVPQYAPPASAIAPVVFGVIKEAHDAWVNWRTTGDWKQGPHGVELMDILFTASGGVVLSGVLFTLL